MRHLIGFGVKVEAQLEVEDLFRSVRVVCCHNMFGRCRSLLSSFLCALFNINVIVGYS